MNIMPPETLNEALDRGPLEHKSFMLRNAELKFLMSEDSQFSGKVDKIRACFVMQNHPQCEDLQMLILRIMKDHDPELQNIVEWSSPVRTPHYTNVPKADMRDYLKTGLSKTGCCMDVVGDQSVILPAWGNLWPGQKVDVMLSIAPSWILPPRSVREQLGRIGNRPIFLVSAWTLAIRYIEGLPTHLERLVKS